MKALVIGSGGREHSICAKLAQSKNISSVCCAPGSSGISQVAKCIDIDVCDFERLSEFAVSENIDFTFVGTEVPLSQGISDFFKAKGLKIIAPSQQASRLESSKVYAKEFMKKYDIATANFRSFGNADDAFKFLESWPQSKKVVIKADGLAAGKGVYICDGIVDAKKIVDNLMNKRVLGVSGAKIIIEEFIDGSELSYLVFTDGVSYSLMPVSQDYKRVNDNDEGANTGGMGSYAPVPSVSKKFNERVENEIIKKVFAGIKAENLDYSGVLYVGVIINVDKPYVLEFNCRLGDPETQSVLPLLETDFSDICTAILNKKLFSTEIIWKNEFAVCVVLASSGYPAVFEKGFEIKGLNNIDTASSFVFHAGTSLKNGKFYTNGGRVLNVVCVGKSLKCTIDNAYNQVKKLHFEGMHYRRDIARKALKEV
ncbi:MAG: phosphoribosylamine--glycine ligase [Elusimicrobiota bacterium]|jgi:phosphoribosylamine--glycine ligase|nr:phosphoribosylamine--glycine ligase [Elusimicrobiota bacterium]